MTEGVSNSSRFSFRRVWAYALYYLPRLKGEMLIYAAISLLCFLLCLIPAPESIQVGIMVGVWTIIPLIFYCGSLIFAKGTDTRIIERLIPVSAAEKLTFYYIYTLIIIPVVVFLLPLAAGWIYVSCPSLQTPEVMQLYEMKFNHWGIIVVINILGGVFTAMACLYGVEASRHNRMLFGIVGVIASNFIIGFLGGVIGVTRALSAVKTGFEDGLAGIARNPEECREAFVKDVLEDLSRADSLTLSITGTIIVLIIITGWLTYRAIKRRNL